MTDPHQPPLELGAPYHIGIVVRDLDTAVARYREVFGIDKWLIRDLGGDEGRPWHWHGEPRTGTTIRRFAYSVSDFPLIELVQANPDIESSATNHLREHGEGVFHVGYFVDDVEAEVERAAALGIAAEMQSGGMYAYLDPGGAHGLRIELVTSRWRSDLLRWLEAGTVE